MGNWKINGLELSDLYVTKDDQRQGWSVTRFNENTEVQTIGRTGTTLPTYGFTVTGNMDEEANVQAIQDSLEELRVSLIESPDVAIHKGELRLPFIAESTDLKRSGRRVTLDVKAILLDAHYEDGGEFSETINGYFDRTGASTYVHYSRDPQQDGDSDTTAIIEVPKQRNGNLKILDVTDGSIDTISSASSFNRVESWGPTRPYETYDVTSYLAGTPAVGEAGAYEVYSEPHTDFLDAP